MEYFGLFDFNGIIIRLLEFFIIDYLVGNLNVNFVENKLLIYFDIYFE